jgi:two-component system chemotaxis sensor kinase CheA
MSAFDHLKTTYFDECAELLESAYAHLSAIEEGRADDDTVHAIFRAFHSIKGGGGAFGFDRLVAFAHELEAALDLLRSGRLALAPPIAVLLLQSTDMLSDLVAATRAGEDKPAGFEDGLLQALRGVVTASTTPGTEAPATGLRQSQDVVQDIQLNHYRIHFVPHLSLFKSANDPLLIIRELMRIGKVRAEVDQSRLPRLAEMNSEDAYLAWTLHVETTAPRTVLEEVFEFVGDDCDLSFDTVEAASVAGTGQSAMASIPAADADVEAVSGGPTEHSVALAAEKPVARDAATSPSPSIRVDVEKVDRLVNLVGELVINQAMLAQLGSRLPPEMCAGLLNGLETMSQHLRELQEGVMAIRAQPVKSVFSRMPRLVREVSTQLGKDVRLVISGEGTEIDKTVIEQLADPLTHLLRNSLDHGIESPAEREAAGKPRQGTVHLGAEHRGGRIVIEVSDDGRGIAREKVMAKARSRGLVAAEASLNDDEIDQLIFLPGFSTVDVVSDISGRGVGMDVVKRNIQALGGRITLESRSGAGSRFQLSLPLTLAILDGMAVAVGPESYVVPLTNIMESLRPKSENIHPVVGQGDVLAIRGEYVPLVYLHQRFGVPNAVKDPCQGIVVIVESEGANRIGLVVDELLGQQQVVVKSLEANYGPVDGIGGATVLGDGRVALILDVSRLKQPSAFARTKDRPTPSAQPSDLH